MQSFESVSMKQWSFQKIVYNSLHFYLFYPVSTCILGVNADDNFQIFHYASLFYQCKKGVGNCKFSLAHCIIPFIIHCVFLSTAISLRKQNAKYHKAGNLNQSFHTDWLYKNLSCNCISYLLSIMIRSYFIICSVYRILEFFAYLG